MANENECGYVLVSNIPSDYHTADLRRFFSDYVEGERLTCFHYRHRPDKNSFPQDGGDVEKRTSGESASWNGSSSTSFSRQVTARVHKHKHRDTGTATDAAESDGQPPRSSCCCAVKLPNNELDNFVVAFHRKHWLDTEDCDRITQCFVARLGLADGKNLANLSELRPPNIMPRGNVGTSTKFFLQAIKDCRLPSKLIGKLKLEFPKGRINKYGSVAYQYEEQDGRVLTIDRSKHKAVNAAGPKMEDPKVESDPEDDDDTCEEWERHEALHNDVQANRTIGRQVNSSSYLAENGDLEQQPGTKEKPFEEEIELVWEKGGSGLNFYTDAQYWKAQEGDFDEQTTDDWDVDMSVYYEKNGSHDKDAVDRFEMRESEFLRSGQHSESVFKRPSPDPGTVKSKRFVYRRPRHNKAGKTDVGRFQAHTTGVGGKIMRASGWRAGMGLGPSSKGIKVALDGEDDGQPARDKKGFGYHGQKIVFATPSAGRSSKPYPPPPPPPPGHRLTSAYTVGEERDPPPRLHRTQPPLYLKFRDCPVKFHSAGTIGGSSRSDIEHLVKANGETSSGGDHSVRMVGGSISSSDDDYSTETNNGILTSSSGSDYAAHTSGQSTTSQSEKSVAQESSIL